MIKPNDYPALDGRPVTQAHVWYCERNGHATHTINGADSGTCPRCGEVTTAAPAVKISNATTPASVGVDVIVPRDGNNGFTRWQFVIIAEHLYFSTLSATGWAPLSRVVDPDRFGSYGSTYPTLRAWAERFFAD